jgi:geranyl-CoA carboxylase alpha subunit
MPELKRETSQYYWTGVGRIGSRSDTIVGFHRLLIANRGEIACRVICTARSMGLRAIAIYSDADADAPHVKMADESVRIGPGPVNESYLSIARVLEAARVAGAQAIHPGYGFLSENAEFARGCEAQGLTFVGPPAEAIALMGNKAEAKRRMIAAGVPCVPGYQGIDQSDGAFASAAKEIGYPVMIKAAAGGGGRGMRLVFEPDALHDAVALARSEASNAFGSDELILEKAIIRPRHVEIQVFGDAHGNVIHIGERDCSVQRRHQKVIEESPCPVMTAALRQRMGSAAIEAARTIKYRSAGTVEFLLDEGGNFYFLEMNTRLQVEHPVTELVSGLDLVGMQIAVAQGDRLELAQDDVQLRGHAIEVRLYAEDPEQGFLPATGHIYRWEPPLGDGVRVDGGVVAGQTISPFYDPMLAKIVSWGPTREVARLRLQRALGDTLVLGPTTNRSFLIAALSQDRFIRGEATTSFIEECFPAGFLQSEAGVLEGVHLATVMLFMRRREEAMKSTARMTPELLDWSSLGHMHSHFRIGVGEETFESSVSIEQKTYVVSVGEHAAQVHWESGDSNSARLTVADRPLEVRCHFAGDKIFLSTETLSLIASDRSAGTSNERKRSGGAEVVAPMHGKVIDLAVEVGEQVLEGQKIAVLEAMKMQYQLVAEANGIVKTIFVNAGKQVAANDILVEIEVQGM